jgi:UDP-GlcNAc:undecaprenyl-phosphate/decaprenyl-phosphate GlcNAc-1-phosphate transferase
MPVGLSVVVAFALAFGVTAVAVPWAIELAHRTRFYDHPGGYKRHLAPTPYLGGLAVVLGLIVGAAALGARIDELVPILAVALAALVVGTIDDRIGLHIAARLAFELAAGATLFYSGFGWSVFGNNAADLVLTLLFVVGVVNAFNLMDNLDGATPTVALVLASAITVYAATHHQPEVAALAIALAGACAGFLPYNLAIPRARIFLGDGGSMAIGITLAGLLMALPVTEGFGWRRVAVIVVFIGLPALDTALVIVSRMRRNVSVFSGGRDHLTHRLHLRLGSSRRVALVLAAGQAALSGIAIALFDIGPIAGAVGAAMMVLTGMVLIAMLETVRLESEVAVGQPEASPAPAPDEVPA